MDYRNEENNYPKAFLATGVILVFIMLLCYFIVFQSPPKQEDGTGGILVNYGTTDEGSGTDYMSTEQPSMAEKANHTKPNKVTPTPATEKVQTESSDKKIVTQNNEDAPEVNTTAKKPSTTVATEVSKKATKPTVNQNALYKGKTNNATGEGDGTTNTPGNQGKPNGSNLANNYNGTGSGNGGIGLGARNFVSKPSVKDDHRMEGKIVIYFHVDKNGNVNYAQAGRGTTISDYDLTQKCINAVKEAKVSALDTAPDTQAGTVVFVFKLY
jgi:outer membrane biosynthesis protein TonB